MLWFILSMPGVLNLTHIDTGPTNKNTMKITKIQYLLKYQYLRKTHLFPCYYFCLFDLFFILYLVLLLSLSLLFLLSFSSLRVEMITKLPFIVDVI